MSSLRVRDQLFNFLAANSPEKFIDFTGEFEDLSELLEKQGIAGEELWVGVDFVGNEETPVSTPATNTEGKYRETGTIYFHVAGIVGLGAVRATLVRAEALRDLLRGRRIGTLVVDSVSPVNTGEGAAIKNEAGYFSASFLVSYEADLDL